jgi:hypothetical protein
VHSPDIAHALVTEPALIALVLFTGLSVFALLGLAVPDFAKQIVESER